MKVLFINPTPLFGGATTATISVANMLQQNGVEVVYSDEYDHLEKRGELFVDKYPFHRRKFKSHLETVNHIVDEVKPTHIIWTPLIMPYYYFEILKMKRMGIRQLTVIHSISLNQNLKGKVVDFLVSRCMTILDAVVFVSNYTLQSWSNSAAVYSHHVKKKVIYNAVSFSGEKRLDTNPRRIGFVGRFSIEKQPEIFCSLSSEHCLHDLEFHAFGDGPLKARCESQYPKVIYHGNVDDINRIYQDIDILVMTSKFENCPMVILEAKTRGIPCVAPRVGGIPEIVINGNDGILYDSYAPSTIVNSIEQIVENYDCFSKHCMNNSTNYSPTAIYANWKHLLNNLE